MRKLALVAAVAATVGVLALPAAAHVSVQPNEALAESFSAFVVRVPNESEEASTVKIQAQFPPLASVRFQDVEGWSRNVKMQKLDEPIELFGEEIDEAVGTVTWSGGEVQPGEFEEFPFSAAMPADEGEIEFKFIQTYSDGEVARWTGPADADRPAARVRTLTLPGAEEGTGQLGAVAQMSQQLEEISAQIESLGAEEPGPADGSATGAAEDDGDEDGSGSTGILLGSIGIALGAAALIISLMKRRT